MYARGSNSVDPGKTNHEKKSPVIKLKDRTARAENRSTLLASTIRDWDEQKQKKHDKASKMQKVYSNKHLMEQEYKWFLKRTNRPLRSITKRQALSIPTSQPPFNLEYDFETNSSFQSND